MSMHASNASMRVSVQVCMYASMSISGTVSVSTLSAIPFVDEYRITTILHPQDRHPNGNTWIGHQGKDHDQDHSTANGQVLHQLLIDDTHLGRGFFFFSGWDVFFSGVSPGVGGFPGCFPKRNHSGSGDYGVRGFFGLV